MRVSPLFLAGFMSVLGLAQSARLDQGRMDPAWFGPGLNFERSTRVYFLWVRPGLSLQGRSLQAAAWEAPAWLVKPRPEGDQAFLRRLEPILIPALVEGLRGELREALPVSREAGEVILRGRVTDCRAEGVGGMFGGLGGLYFDLKLTDGRSGELLVAAHHFIEGATAESIQNRYEAWSRTFAKVLAEKALPPLKPGPLAPLKPMSPSQPLDTVPATARPAAVQAPGAPALDLEHTLRRLEALRRDGLLTEEEFQILRKQAVERAKAQN